MNTYLIIGAGPGIAIETARRFAREGFRIVLAARTGKRIASAVAELRRDGAAVELETLDASDPAGVAALVGRHARDLSVLHYNAAAIHYDAQGQLQLHPLEQETLESLAADTNTNLLSALSAIKAAADIMAPRGAGTILLTGGGLSLRPHAGLLALSIGKAGLRAAAQALFEPMQLKNIHLATVTVSTLVSPGSAKAGEVADAFLRLHRQPKDQWDWELVVN